MTSSLVGRTCAKGNAPNKRLRNPRLWASTRACPIGSCSNGRERGASAPSLSPALDRRDGSPGRVRLQWAAGDDDAGRVQGRLLRWVPRPEVSAWPASGSRGRRRTIGYRHHAVPLEERGGVRCRTRRGGRADCERTDSFAAPRGDRGQKPSSRRQERKDRRSRDVPDCGSDSGPLSHRPSCERTADPSNDGVE